MMCTSWTKLIILQITVLARTDLHDIRTVVFILKEAANKTCHSV